MPFPSLLRRQEPGLKHSFSCLSMLAFAKMLKQLKLITAGSLPAKAEKGIYKDRPVCFMKIVDFMRTITPFHGVHTMQIQTAVGTISAA